VAYPFAPAPPGTALSDFAGRNPSEIPSRTQSVSAFHGDCPSNPFRFFTATWRTREKAGRAPFPAPSLESRVARSSGLCRRSGVPAEALAGRKAGTDQGTAVNDRGRGNSRRLPHAKARKGRFERRGREGLATLLQNCASTKGDRVASSFLRQRADARAEPFRFRLEPRVAEPRLRQHLHQVGTRVEGVDAGLRQLVLRQFFLGDDV